MDDPVPGPAGPPPARFSDRLCAFSIDAAVFSCGYFASAVVLAASAGPARFEALVVPWILLWTALFIAYHGWYAADGRRTLGKRALGIQVATVDNELPNLRISAVRAVGYLPSGLFLCLGFLWALRGGRAWHDRLAGTWVAEVDGRSPVTRKTATVAAWALGLTMVAAWVLLVVIAPSLARGKLIAHGQKGVKSLVYLEGQYRKARGAYATEPAELFALSEEAAQIGRELPGYLDLATLRLSQTPEGLVVEAAALDEKRTLLRAVVAPAP